MSRRAAVVCGLALLIGCKDAPAPRSVAPITQAQVVALAERFVAENGYALRSDWPLKEQLDAESLDWAMSREETLEMRANSLNGKAIGARPHGRGREPGWSVAFDHAHPLRDQRGCRTVTMNPDGTGMVMQHVDGIRAYFVGFE